MMSLPGYCRISAVGTLYAAVLTLRKRKGFGVQNQHFPGGGGGGHTPRPPLQPWKLYPPPPLILNPESAPGCVEMCLCRPNILRIMDYCFTTSYRSY